MAPIPWSPLCLSQACFFPWGALPVFPSQVYKGFLGLWVVLSSILWSLLSPKIFSENFRYPSSWCVALLMCSSEHNCLFQFDSFCRCLICIHLHPLSSERLGDQDAFLYWYGDGDILDGISLAFSRHMVLQFSRSAVYFFFRFLVRLPISSLSWVVRFNGECSWVCNLGAESIL